jgi:hypothetical protein
MARPRCVWPVVANLPKPWPRSMELPNDPVAEASVGTIQILPRVKVNCCNARRPLHLENQRFPSASLAVARQRGALLFELRTARSLAEWRINRDRPHPACAWLTAYLACRNLP